MCGRTRLSVPPSDLADVFEAPLAPWTPAPNGPSSPDPLAALNLNCAPTDAILVARRVRDSDARELVVMKWGLVPFFVRDFRDAKPIINARVETVATSRAFRESFKKRRCLVIADGFYEWSHVGKKKLPHLIQRPDGAPFGFAAIWDRWKGVVRHGGAPERIETCAVITRSSTPVAAIAAVHDRMPVALEKRDHVAWLDPATEPPALHDILDRAVTDWVVTPIERVPESSVKKAQLRLFTV